MKNFFIAKGRGKMRAVFCFKEKRAVTILEYALLLVALATATMAAQVFLRRAVSFKWKETADGFGFGRQYITQGEHKTVITSK